MAQDARARIEETAAYMERHLGEHVTRDLLAELAGMNPEHYSRLFRKYKGQSPIDYLTALRMEQAKALMRLSDLPVAVVARQVGFADPYYFSRRFRQSVGVPPSSYRRPAQKRVVAIDYYEYFRLLGCEPVGVDGGKVSGYFADWSETAVDVGGDCPDTGRIRELEPDLIVTSREELAPDLSALGRTVVLQMEKDPVYEQLPAIAALVGKEDEASCWTAAYERRASELRDRLALAATGGPAAVLRVRGNFLQMYGLQNMGYPLYRALRLDPPDKIGLQQLCNRYFHSSVIVSEELPFYAAQHLFVVVQPDQATRLAWDKLRATDVWRQYPAVRGGNVYELDVRRWLAFDPASIAEQMEEAASLLLRRAEQGPSLAARA